MLDDRSVASKLLLPKSMRGWIILVAIGIPLTLLGMGFALLVAKVTFGLGALASWAVPVGAFVFSIALARAIDFSLNYQEDISKASNAIADDAVETIQSQYEIAKTLQNSRKQRLIESGMSKEHAKLHIKERMILAAQHDPEKAELISKTIDLYKIQKGHTSKRYDNEELVMSTFQLNLNQAKSAFGIKRLGSFFQRIKLYLTTIRDNLQLTFDRDNSTFASLESAVNDNEEAEAVNELVCKIDGNYNGQDYTIPKGQRNTEVLSKNAAKSNNTNTPPDHFYNRESLVQNHPHAKNLTLQGIFSTSNKERLKRLEAAVKAGVDHQRHLKY